MSTEPPSASPKAIKLTWAQRMKTVLITCNVFGASNISAVVDPQNLSRLTVSMTGTSVDYDTPTHFHEVFELYASIDPNAVLVHSSGRNVYIRVSKRGTGTAAFWPRLLHDAADQKRRKNISVDWTLWKDEDDIAEEAEEEEFAAIGPLKAFTMSNGVNVNGGGDPDVVAKLLNNSEQ